jgi:ribA/ribD-fused uncharacterized protein
MEMTDAIGRFAGPHRFFSNFYPSPFTLDDVLYPTNEHFFNAMKTEDLDARAYIAAAPTPAEAKRRGRSCQLRPNWDQTVRYGVMRVGLREKFSDPELRRQLLDTGVQELVEGNDWHDTHWGVCHCARHAGAGDNHLGRLLMELRAQLRHQSG